jgi:PAS domain-containing protein
MRYKHRGERFVAWRYQLDETWAPADRNLLKAIRSTIRQGLAMKAPKIPGNTELEGLRERIRGLEIQKSMCDQFNQKPEMYRRIMEASQDCIKVTDLTGNLMLMSENGLRITEIDNLMPFIGQPWASLWPPEAASIVNQAVATAAAADIARFTGFCPTAKERPNGGT